MKTRPKLWPHQERFLKENPDKALLAWEMRTGKSLPASIWIDDPCRAGNTYIITPKQNKKDWQRMDTKATVLTKEEFKKLAPMIMASRPTAIVVDEIHYFASALFIRGRSQLATALYTLLKKYPECHILGLTATPIRQDAISLHTLLHYIGIVYPWQEWRSRFFHKEDRPYLPFPAWMPNDDWRIKIRPYLEKHCDIVSLRDIVDDLPPLDPVFVKVKQKPYKKPDDEIVSWMHEHQHEQQGKAKEIAKLGYRKLLIVAHYTAQIDELAKELSKDKPVFVLDGHTKDADAMKRAAQEADDCYFIVQSSMGFGFDGWMFGAIVFASMSHSCVNHTQMLGRMRHLDHLKQANAYYLLGGRWDKRIYDTIEAGKDFNPHIYE